MSEVIWVEVKVRADACSLTDRQELVGSALAKAAARSLRRSRSTVLDRRGDLVEVRLHGPRFRWTGPKAGDVSADIRAEVEDCIERALARSSAAAP
jgi:hypothetical protein